MKKVIIYTGLFLLFAGVISAQQQFSTILDEIEQNNTTLEALRQKAEARQLESHTGIYLENPEFGFNYLWGKPGEVGKRTDINVVQSFDFPTAYKYRSNIADLKFEQAMQEYHVERARIL